MSNSRNVTIEFKFILRPNHQYVFLLFVRQLNNRDVLLVLLYRLTINYAPKNEQTPVGTE